MHLLNKCETCNKCRGCSIASLREGGGPRSGGRSLRDFAFNLTSLLRALLQSPSAPAPSRREPSLSHSSAYINKIPTNRLIGLWELFVAAISPLRTTEKWVSLLFLTYNNKFPQALKNKTWGYFYEVIDFRYYLSFFCGGILPARRGQGKRAPRV